MEKELIGIICQGRFKHLLEPENGHLMKAGQEEVDRKWVKLFWKSGVKS